MQIENLTPEQLKNALVPYVEKWAPDCEFKFDETTEDDASGSYNMIGKTITIRYLPLLKDSEALKREGKDIPLLEHALVTLAHEIGHHQDKKLISMKLKGGMELDKAFCIKNKSTNERDDEQYLQHIANYCKIEFFNEIRAWQNAKRIVKGEIPKEIFYYVFRDCLSSYLDGYKKIYEQTIKDYYNEKTSGAT